MNNGIIIILKNERIELQYYLEILKEEFKGLFICLVINAKNPHISEYKNIVKKFSHKVILITNYTNKKSGISMISYGVRYLQKHEILNIIIIKRFKFFDITLIVNALDTLENNANLLISSTSPVRKNIRCIDTKYPFVIRNEISMFFKKTYFLNYFNFWYTFFLVRKKLGRNAYYRAIY